MRTPKSLALVLLASVSCGGRPESATEAVPESSVLGGPSRFRTASDGAPAPVRSAEARGAP